jgi:AraC-like DNA-binding protein
MKGDTEPDRRTFVVPMSPAQRRLPKSPQNPIPISYHALSNHMLNGLAHCRMFFDAAKNPLDFIYLDVNPAFETLTGMKNVVGKRICEVVPGVRSIAAPFFEICGQVALTGAPRRFVYHTKALNRCFEVSAYCPAHEHFVAIFDVITGCRRAQRGMCDAKQCHQQFISGTACEYSARGERIVHLGADGSLTGRPAGLPGDAIPICGREMAVTPHPVSSPLRSGFIQPGASSRAQRFVRTIAGYVQKNYHRPINLDDVASAMKMNRFYISTRFSKNTGMTFQHFLQDVRLSHARELLRAMGYASLDAFRHAFKKQVGLSPEAWRAKR